MEGTALGALVLLLVAGAGLVAASLLALRSLVDTVLAAYVIGVAEIVALCLFLSVSGEITRTPLVLGSGMFLGAVVGVRLLVGGAPRPSVPAGAIRSLATSKPVLVLGSVIAVAVTYVVALTVSTAPNGWDQLNYHLARAALWLEHGIGYIDGAYDQRLNIYPPVGEIPFSFILGVTKNENLAALAQLFAALACAAGVFALGRRWGLRHPEAIFGALLFLALPIVLLQSSTTKNDLVVASLLVSASVFVLGDSRRSIAIASLAIALAVGAKFTAGYGLVVLLALAVTARPRALVTWRIGGIVIGALVGSFWYFVNAAEGGGLLGDRSNIPGLTATLKPRENAVSLTGLIVDWLDLSGAQGEDILLYLVAASVVAGGLALAGRCSRTPWSRSAAGAALLVASPLALWVLSVHVGRPALVSLYRGFGEPEAFLAEGAPAASPTSASDTGSWFGPAGLVLVVGVAIAAVVLTRRGAFERTAVVAAGAPLAWLLLVSLTLTYHPWQGRFFIYPVALSASLWGLALRSTAFAWGAVALTATTGLLALAHYSEKPSGVRLLDRSPTSSVWQMERWEVQSLHDPALAPVFEFLDENVGSQDSIALALGANDFGYPAFGAHVERRVVLVPFGSTERDIETDWLLANPERAAEIDRSCWLERFSSESGMVFERQPERCTA